MPEIDDLDAIDPGNVSDDDLLVLFDVGGGVAGKVTRAQFLAGVAMDGGDHDFGTSEIADLSATVLAAGTVDVATRLNLGGGANLTDILATAGDLVVGDLTAATGSTHTLTLTGAATTDHLIATLSEPIADGLTWQAWISATNTVSFRFWNPTAGTITGATYSVRAMAIRTT